MSRSFEPSRPAGPVELLDVTDLIVGGLLAAALNNADAYDADEVTPPPEPRQGSARPQWWRGPGSADRTAKTGAGSGPGGRRDAGQAGR